MNQTNEFKETWLDLHHCGRHRDGQCMYQVSNHGNVRMKTKDGYVTVKQRLNPNGYMTVSLLNAVYVRQIFHVHKLVAVTFIPNPAGFDSVDHKDGNRLNNSSRNLQWMPLAENIRKGHESGAIRREFKAHPVRLEKDNREIVYPTLSKAAYFLECSVHAVQSAAKGHYKIHGWKVTSLAQRIVNGNIFRPEDFE